MALAAPPILATERRRASLSALPRYWHLLSLDAPTVAVLWSWSFTHAAHLAPANADIAVLGIGTWLIYVLDRILDARAPGDHLRERHFFHARHRRPLLLGCCVACVPLLWLIAARMSPAARREDTILFSASVLYFAAVHLPAAKSPILRRRFPREPAVGILFALACAVPAWSQTWSTHAELTLPVLLFAALCSLNCMAIESWERPACEARSRAVPALAAAISLAATVVLLRSAHHPGEMQLAASILISALLLLALDHRRGFHRAGSTLAFRIAADAVLLTPLLLVLPLRG